MQQSCNACLGLIRLTEHYGEERFENACKRAVPASRVSYGMISNILKKGLDKQPDDTLTEPPDLFTHENIRGPEAFK